MRKTQDNNDINSIATGSVLSGDLHTKSDIRVDGEVKGSVKTEGKLVLGETGLIEGQIFCKNAVVSGEIRATINVEELLTLKSTAKLNGEIVSEKLAIEPGAIFSGKCSMGPVIKNINESKDQHVEAKDKTA
tara:strand:+ start:358 stop:753 length:396 start_codon:yes stop_codon:yes gene_type:complete